MSADAPVPGFPRLTTNPDRCGGKPTVRGLRIPASLVASLAAGWGRAAVLRAYPELTEEDIDECQRWAVQHASR